MTLARLICIDMISGKRRRISEAEKDLGGHVEGQPSGRKLSKTEKAARRDKHKEELDQRKQELKQERKQKSERLKQEKKEFKLTQETKELMGLLHSLNTSAALERIIELTTVDFTRQGDSDNLIAELAKHVEAWKQNNSTIVMQLGEFLVHNGLVPIGALE